MTLVTTRKCIVYETLEAEAYVLTLQVPESEGANIQWEEDLSAKARDRLVAGINRLLRPHVKRTRKAKA